MSLPLIFRFSFTNEDLLTAYNARLDYVCRPALRYSLIAAGCVFLLGPVTLFLLHCSLRFGFIDWILAIIGVVLLRAWAIAPLIRRRRIRMESGAAKTIRIIVDETSLVEETADSSRNVRGWDDVSRISDMPKGFLIYFRDGELWWLPTRIFNNIDEREEFMNLAANKGRL